MLHEAGDTVGCARRVQTAVLSVSPRVIESNNLIVFVLTEAALCRGRDGGWCCGSHRSSAGALLAALVLRAFDALLLSLD